ncbi:hypothetical protein L249_8789 [Ophiocordyceps polyrhachis-furcata BCC 54312]|uniref:Uncharacterized protein n=1 Tax=Ophiocordyceps polyrhachis-furcata BCC 54312 TaxID=1330021 RepID=A0A367L2X1_9HYPO|nr:hypothetical protein L249_8789 [Ophiocordyceps polyrhachis-furcata BCC 54312]
MTLPICAVRARALVRTPQLFSKPQQMRRYSATVVDVGFWKSLMPKAWRREKKDGERRPKSKGWNPATYFIIMFLFVGSMSIQMIVLRKQSEQEARQSAVKVSLLREIIEKIRNGENVDVEKALGTGDAEREANWAEVLRAIERDATRRNPSKGEKSGEEDYASKTQPGEKKTTGIESFF